MLQDAISYPNRGKESMTTLLIGGGLTIVWWLVIPLVLMWGYFLRVLDRTANGVDEPPQFDEIGELAKDGVIGFVISMVYVFVPLFVVGLLLGGGSIVGALAGGEAGASMAMGSMVLAGLVLFVLLIVVMYIYPAALSSYATQGSFGAGFDFGTIFEVITSPQYIGAWVVGFLAFVIGWAVMFVLTTVLSIIPIIGTIVGWVIGAIGNFYIQVVAYRAFGVAYRRALE